MEGISPVTLADVRRHPVVAAYIRQADQHLAAIGYTEHGERHCKLVANIAYNVLNRLGHGRREAELAAIAGYTHDVGNVVSREGHAQAGAVIMAGVLHELGMPPEESGVVLGAIGNHEETHGHPVNPVSAALILADKTDVHRTRVRNQDAARFDIHDRVNYAAVRSFLNVDEKARTMTLDLSIERDITSVMEYFEIFLTRMIMCRRAAEFLECQFNLIINGARLL